MSFRLKTILGIASIEAILLLILIGYSLNTLKASNEEELLKRAHTTAALFATTTQNAVLANDLASIESFVNNVITNPGIVYARVSGSRGVLAEKGDPFILARPFAPNKTLEDVDDDIFDAYADIIVSGQRYGRVEIGFSISNIKKAINDARSRTIGIAIIEMGLVALFSFFLGLYLTRGLNALKQASEEISEGGFGYQVQISGSDEIAQTAMSFNKMSVKLKTLDDERKKAEDELAKLNEDLERRVKQRTEQLVYLTKELKHQSLHDSLTKLPNRTLYNDRLHQIVLIGQREKQQFTILLLDLDNFKDINDTMGHHTGDLVLQQVGIRLRSSLRASDTVARMGGDEFAMLLPTANNSNGAITTAQKILKIIEKPLEIAGQTLLLKASIGIAMFPEHGDEINMLMRRADAAMYAAKRRKAGFIFYDHAIDQEISDYMALKTELGNAIFSNELILHYQPKLDITSGQIIGVEALARWQHPKHGLLFPKDFIPLSEETGMIKQLTIQVLKIALSECEKWHKAKLNLPISVNISTINLQDPEFPEEVADVLKNFDIPYSLLELEVTETAVMTEPLQAIEAITKLSNMGIQISIDDFGTGYSSMALLKKLLVAKIKIDKSFITDMLKNNSDAVIVRAAIEFGHNLGFKVVAEGVESQEVWNHLKDLGCDSAQGYFMSHPLPSDKLIEWMQQAQLKRKN